MTKLALNYKEIGVNIRAARKRMNMTIEGLANLCKLTEKYLGNVERGYAKPSLNAIVKIANVLNIGTEDLLGSNVNVHCNRFCQTDEKEALKILVEEITPEQCSFLITVATELIKHDQFKTESVDDSVQ